jgi:hypothetical protein
MIHPDEGSNAPADNVSKLSSGDDADTATNVEYGERVKRGKR